VMRDSKVNPPTESSRLNIQCFASATSFST
jgi:hypothetical protein